MAGIDSRAEVLPNTGWMQGGGQRCRRGDHGFTLLELLLALSLFGLVSAMAYGGMRSVMEAGVATRQQAALLGALQLAFGRLGRDLEQVVPRPIRDEYGDSRAAVLASGSLPFRVEFTRAGEPNPARLLRSNLKRVGYVVRGGALVRLIWPVLDRGDAREPYEQVLIADVADARFRFLDNEGQWRTDWPPIGEQETTDVMLPRAVEISVTMEGFDEVSRLFRIAG